MVSVLSNAFLFVLCPVQKQLYGPKRNEGPHIRVLFSSFSPPVFVFVYRCQDRCSRRVGGIIGGGGAVAKCGVVLLSCWNKTNKNK